MGFQDERARQVPGRDLDDGGWRWATPRRVGVLSAVVVLLVSGATAATVLSAQTALREGQMEALESRTEGRARYLGAYLADIAARLDSLAHLPPPGDTMAWEALAGLIGLDELSPYEGEPTLAGRGAAPDAGQGASGTAGTWILVADGAGGHELHRTLPPPQGGPLRAVLSLGESSQLGEFLLSTHPGPGYARVLLTPDGEVVAVAGRLAPDLLAVVATSGPIPSTFVGDGRRWLLSESDVPSTDLRTVLLTSSELAPGGVLRRTEVAPWLVWCLMTLTALGAAILVTRMTDQRLLLRRSNAHLADRQREVEASAAIVAALNDVDDLEHAVTVLRRELGQRLGARSVEFLPPDAPAEELPDGDVGTVPVLDGGRLRGFLRVGLTQSEQDHEDVLRVVAASLTAVWRREAVLGELHRSNDDLSRFALVAAHDLQEPLRKVTVFSTLLDRRYVDQLGSEAKELLGYVIDGSQRMGLLVDELLTYARVDPDGHQHRRVSLEEIVREAKANLSLTIAETAGVVRIDRLPEVSGNPPLLLQLFQNLLANALKFHAGPPRIRVRASHCDGAVHVTVRDEGIGVAPADAERMFDLFERVHTHGHYPGAGIGLAICQRIVEAHDGRIWAASGPDPGTTVHVVLPSAGPLGPVQ
jgi:signal transduction histidine kinase